MKEKYIGDLREIKDIMVRSSRFSSLSGWSGVVAGLIALAGGLLAYFWVFDGVVPGLLEAGGMSGDARLRLLVVMGLTMLLAMGAVFGLSRQGRRRREREVGQAHLRPLLTHFFVPLGAGGAMSLFFLFHDLPGMLPATTLIFYGLATFSASKYSIPEIGQLGIKSLLLGLLALIFPAYALLWWLLGFGALHIIYGLYLQLKSKA